MSVINKPKQKYEKEKKNTNSETSKICKKVGLQIHFVKHRTYVEHYVAQIHHFCWTCADTYRKKEKCGQYQK